MDRDGRPSSPHWLRFARALALVSLAGGASVAAGCDQTAGFACAHCHCQGAPMSLSRPITCDTIGHGECCMVIIEGPLPPPDLAA